MQPTRRAPKEFDDLERELDRLEPAWADFVHGVRTGMRHRRADRATDESMLTRTYLEIRDQFEVYRRRHVDGDALALTEALQLACLEPVPLPYWLAIELQRRLLRFWNEPITLHEAMGLDGGIPSDGKKAAAARQELRLRHRIWRDVGRLRFKHRHEYKKQHPDDQGLSRFKELSLYAAFLQLKAEDRLHMGKTRFYELYNLQDRIWRLHAGRR